MEEVKREWRKLHNEELNVLYSSTNIFWVMKSRRLRWAVHVIRMGKRSGVYVIFAGKPKGKKSLRRPRRTWENNIKIDVHEVGCGAMD